MAVFFCIVLIALLATIAWIDFRRQVIPDFLNLALGVSGAVSSIALGRPGQIDAIVGSLGAATFFLLLRWVYRQIRGVTGLGLGDVKFLASAGFWVGATGVPWLLLFASLSGLFYVLAYSLVFGQIDRGTRIAFGPHLAIGLLAVWAAGNAGYL